MRPVWIAAVLGASLVSAAPLAAQISAAASRWLTDPHVTDYRLSFTRYWFGPVALVPLANVVVQGPRSGGAFLVGAGGEAIVRLTSGAAPYLVGGLSVGFLDFRRTLGVSLWSAWSAGAGFELLRVAGIGVAPEVRYQRLSRDGTNGASIGLRLGSALGHPTRGPAPVEERRPPQRRADAIPSLSTAARARPALDVVETARAAMGTPYQWGGTDANGFDCSGLIQYAYQAIGLSLPRQSRDQARAGRSVGTSLDALEPGDILAFADRPGGDRVTHVGLYLGDGAFIHSTSTGVRTSGLSDRDPDGKWWVVRLIDARRVIE